MSAIPTQANQRKKVSRYARVCKHCGTLNGEGGSLPGQGWIEFILWFCYLIPGIIYSVWRRSEKNRACESRKNRDMVGIESPIGQKLLAEHYEAVDIVDGPKPRKKSDVSWGRIGKIILYVFLAILVWAFIYGRLNHS